MLFRDTPLANCEAYFVSIFMCICILPVAVHYFISSILSTLRVAIALSKFFKVFFLHFSALKRLGAIYFYMEIYFVWEGNYSLLKAKKKKMYGRKICFGLALFVSYSNPI